MHDIDWTQIILVILGLIGTILTTFIMPRLMKLLDTKVAAIQNTDLRDGTAHILALAAANIQTAVAETAQTYVDGIKGTSGWDPSAQAAAFEQAKSRFLQLMGDDGKALLASAVTDVEAWIKANIEASVQFTKAA